MYNVTFWQSSIFFCPVEGGGGGGALRYVFAEYSIIVTRSDKNLRRKTMISLVMPKTFYADHSLLEKRDQCMFLENCPPTPPQTWSFAQSDK